MATAGSQYVNRFRKRGGSLSPEVCAMENVIPKIFDFGEPGLFGRQKSGERRVWLKYAFEQAWYQMRERRWHLIALATRQRHAND